MEHEVEITAQHHLCIWRLKGDEFFTVCCRRGLERLIEQKLKPGTTSTFLFTIRPKETHA